MTKQSPNNLPNDILWGCAAIARYIRRSERQTYYLAATGAIPTRKLGPRTLVARKSELDRALAHEEDVR
jgi:hypothetical protein